MSVWVCIPSARPASIVAGWVERWKSKGYHVALWRDDGQPIIGCDLTMGGTYPGYPIATNTLIKEVLAKDSACDWTVATGDDTECDGSHTAYEIAEDCGEYFLHDACVKHAMSGSIDRWPTAMAKAATTFGVMQPTGDSWSDSQGRIIERICGSPWLGREFCRRINQGTGPLWHEYFHNWADQELQMVSQRLGVLWQRPDLTHYHDHSWRRNNGQWDAHQLGFSADYIKFRPLFESRQRNGFPGSEPL